jgi:uncharacterized protein YukE
MSDGTIRVTPDALHSAGASVSNLGSQLGESRGVGGAAAASAAGAAAHPDAQAAIGSYWEQTEKKMGMTYALINALADALHQAADTYGEADHVSGQSFDGGHPR